MTPSPFLYSLREVLNHPEVVVNDTTISELIGHLSETTTKPLSALMSAAYIDIDEIQAKWRDI